MQTTKTTLREVTTKAISHDSEVGANHRRLTAAAKKLNRLPATSTEREREAARREVKAARRAIRNRRRWIAKSVRNQLPR